jgi:hypothetical protein
MGNFAEAEIFNKTNNFRFPSLQHKILSVFLPIQSVLPVSNDSPLLYETIRTKNIDKTNYLAVINSNQEKQRCIAPIYNFVVAMLYKRTLSIKMYQLDQLRRTEITVRQLNPICFWDKLTCQYE